MTLSFIEIETENQKVTTGTKTEMQIDDLLLLRRM